VRARAKDNYISEKNNTCPSPNKRFGRYFFVPAGSFGYVPKASNAINLLFNIQIISFMHRTDFIPRKDEDFLRWSTNFMTALSGIAQRVAFPEATRKALTALQTTFVTKYNVAVAPATRTKASIDEKTEARDAFEKELRQNIREYLTNNHLVTDADRDNLGLPIHKSSHTPSPVAKTYPEFNVDSGTIRRLTIHFFDQGSVKSKAKPAGRHGAEIRWAILDTPPADVKDLAHSSFDTRTPFTLEFEEHERGKTVCFCLCWENTRGKKDPWSEIVSAIIP
jgi:hypothetical protein